MATEMVTHVSDPQVRAPLGIIGGSGFYSLFDDATPVDVYTPFGTPSEAVLVGHIGDLPVAFLPRHGKGHRFAPHRVNYRANLWALRAVGVRQVVAPCAVGSLLPHQGPGTLVVPDQIIDRTWGRPHTYYERDGEVLHVAFADPYCPRGRAAAVAAARAVPGHGDGGDGGDGLGSGGSAHGDPAHGGGSVVDGGTLVVINGPRFSTRAESRSYAAAGATVIGMTTMPEAALARELAMCFTTVCLVTDLDAGVEVDAGVTQAEVFELFAANMPRVKSVVARTAAALGADAEDVAAGCGCRKALDGIDVPFDLPG